MTNAIASINTNNRETWLMLVLIHVLLLCIFTIKDLNSPTEYQTDLHFFYTRNDMKI